MITTYILALAITVRGEQIYHIVKTGYRTEAACEKDRARWGRSRPSSTFRPVCLEKETSK